jgi:hypothetical protein
MKQSAKQSAKRTNANKKSITQLQKRTTKMKCKICGHGISAYQIKYGDANPPQRDENGKITSRGFHHDCVYALEEKEQLEAEHKTIEAQEAARESKSYNRHLPVIQTDRAGCNRNG